MNFDDQVVKPGMKVKKPGVLVSIPRYREYQEDLEMYDVLKDFKPCPQLDDPCAEEIDSVFWTMVGSLAIGFAAGFYLRAP